MPLLDKPEPEKKVRKTFLGRMSIFLNKKTKKPIKKFIYDSNPTEVVLFPSTTSYHLSHPLNTPHLSSFLFLALSIPILFFISRFVPSGASLWGVAVVVLSILWENMMYLFKIKWSVITIIILLLEGILWSYLECWESTQSLE